MAVTAGAGVFGALPLFDLGDKGADTFAVARAESACGADFFRRHRSF